MTVYTILCIIITLAAVFAYLIARFTKLPTTIGVMMVTLLVKLKFVRTHRERNPGNDLILILTNRRGAKIFAPLSWLPVYKLVRKILCKRFTTSSRDGRHFITFVLFEIYSILLYNHSIVNS